MNCRRPRRWGAFADLHLDVPVPCVHAGESLAGNDCSDASCTMSKESLPEPRGSFSANAAVLSWSMRLGARRLPRGRSHDPKPTAAKPTPAKTATTVATLTLIRLDFTL